MRNILIAVFIWFLPHTAYAGVGACHDGNGNITVLTADYARKADFEQANCVSYSPGIEGVTQQTYDRIYAVVTGFPVKYIKWLNEPIEKTAQEKAAVDALETTQAIAQLRTTSKAQFDGQQVTGLALRCEAKVILDEINTLRAAYPIPVVSITRSGTIATVTTRWAHNLTGTPQVTVHGATVANYNGAFTIAVTGATTFTYTVSGSPATPAAGSLMAFPINVGMNPRTLAQAKTAIQNCIDLGQADE